MLEASVNEYREGAMKLFREDFPGQSKLYYSRAALFFAGFPYDLMRSPYQNVHNDAENLEIPVAKSNHPVRVFP